ncbi:hypothetical protein HAX54_022497 [Datura stramonium]|uniref:Uncharacterized protein n=1 Tax=Datura stramonium TaxID=4076 RepID=A0ABS8UWH9_DATST|nr:hypothetical protein [Datura stramonium]
MFSFPRDATMSNSSSTSIYIRFMNKQRQFWWNEKVAKGLVHECCFIMHDVEKKTPEFYVRLQEIGWGPLVEEPYPVTYVREVQISINVASINEALGSPNPSEADLKARDVDGNGRRFMDTLVVEEKRASYRWGMTALASEALTLLLKLGGG